MLVTFGSVLQPRGGLPVRSRIAAEALAGLGMPPAIVTTHEPSEGRDQLPPWIRELHVMERRPRRGISLELARTIARVAQHNDLLVVGNAMFWPALTLAHVRLPVVWDTNECQLLHYSRLPQTLRNRTARLAWLVLESWAARTCSLAVAISEREADWWTAYHPQLADKLAVVNHGPLFNRKDDEATRMYLSAVCGAELSGPVVVFVGTMIAKHNRAAADWLLEVLAPRLPAGASLVLCGPGSELLLPTPGTAARVFCVGAVEDVDAVIAASDLCVAPLTSGAGVKTKVLHYLAHGKAVAGTPLAFEGIEDAPGISFAALEHLPQLVLELLAKSEEANQASERRSRQQAWVEQNHGRQRVMEQWKEALICKNRLAARTTDAS